MSEKLEVGDVVRLKSDNLKMVVESINANTGKIKCVWRNPSEVGIDRSNFYAPALLEKYEESEVKLG